MHSYIATLKAAATCFLLLVSANAFAYEGIGSNNDRAWYQIEYIIFEHLKTDDHILRYEDTPYPVNQSKQYSFLTTNPSPSSPFQFTVLDKNQGVLTEALKRLNRSPLVKVLDAGAWQQSLSASYLSPPLRINKNVTKQRQLIGEIQLKKSRYTHAAFNLHLTKSFEVPFKDISDWFAEKNTQWRIIDLITPINDKSSTDSIGTNHVFTDTLYLGESRRIKNGEIHYIDHPVFSAMITIKEVPHPEVPNSYMSYTGE